MPGTAKSSVITSNPKPNNVFYIWYTELCRRMNSNPSAILRPAKPKSNTILDFVADRLKFEDWSPVINALRHDTSLHVIIIRSRMSNYQFLHDIDTEDKARRMRRKYGSLWTDYILNSLVRALSYSIKNTQVLTSLELDGLPMFGHYLDELLKALKENKTVKNLSLANCSIQDTGCRSMCLCLQLIPNVETLNLSRCDLTSVSGIYIAKLIKFQQLNRYTTSWHKSLRYSEPDSEKMCGIRRITLNCNPKIGDEGLNYILGELEDDLWIKALDMQKCGITENIAKRLLDIIQYNQSLKIADFRQNEDLSASTLKAILELLKKNNQNDDNQSNFQWCKTELSLCPSTITSSRGIINSGTDETFIFRSSKVNGMKKDSKTKTAVDIMKRNNRNENGRKLNEHAKNITQPNVGTGQAIIKREYESHTLNSVIKSLEKLQFPSDLKMIKDAPNNTPNISPIKKNQFSYKYSKQRNGTTKNTKNGFINERGPNVSAANSASNLFARYFYKESSFSEEEETLKDYCDDYNIEPSTLCSNSEIYIKKDDFSESQTSLADYLQDLHQDKAALPSDPKKSTSKHHYKGKKNGIK
ncbi:hypothetical protein HHI36_005680 [Cryptolaemus montrouzieri]|uniref:Centrosomal protein of 78 kDa n=1 Tax=Cryptolaemus montrouzieri TaxID=559131 RepID=A0ABD2NUW9_9CUCU